MDGNDIGARLEKRFDIAIRVRNHQMDIKREFGHFSQTRDNGRTHGDVGNEIAVHHVHMNPVRTGFFDGQNFLTQLAAVRGKN